MPADIIDEGFEGTGIPSGWWAGSSGNFDYTASPLSGSQSLRCAAGEKALYLSGGALNHGEIWFKMLFKAETLPSGPEKIIEIYDATQSFTVYSIELQPSGELQITPDAGTPTTVDTISAGTIYNIWGYYKNVGTNASLGKCSFATVGNSRPNSGNAFASGIHLLFAQDAGLLFIPSSSTNTVAKVFDDFQVSSTDIFAGAATVTVNLTGVGASPAVGSLTFNGSFSVAGVAASPAIGTGTVTTDTPATVSVTLTGVTATPSIGIGHVAIEGEVITPPVEDLVPGRMWYGLPEDEKVYLTGVAANPQVGEVKPFGKVTRDEFEKMYPFPRKVEERPLPVARKKAKPPKPVAFVYMAGVHPVPKIGRMTIKAFYEDSDEELSSILKMMDVDEELISALKLAK